MATIALGHLGKDIQLTVKNLLISYIKKYEKKNTIVTSKWVSKSVATGDTTNLSIASGTISPKN